MKIQKNTKQVWDAVWNDPGLNIDDKIILESERATIRWSRLKKVLLTELGNLQNLKIIEIGAGIGTYSALLASEGATPTLLDYSEVALQRAKGFFQNNGLQANCVLGDALNLPEEILKNNFDVSISVGVAEHFKGRERIKINKAHFDVLKKNGIAVIIVPNKYNPPYRMYKFISELFGTWKFGEEYPYSRGELRDICNKLHHTEISIFGDDLYQSIKFLLPANFLRRFFKVGKPKTLAAINVEKGTPFDKYLGYSLILVARK